MKTQKLIESTCDSIKNMLLEKNKKYGDSALSPVRVFSKADAVEQILVRIDDKLSRISKGAGLVADDEDVVNDLIGYLILLKVAKQQDSPGWDGSDIEPGPARNSAIKYDDIISFATDFGDSYLGNNMANTWISSSQEDSTLADVYSSGDRFA
jgi:hypothetical protein